MEFGVQTLFATFCEDADFEEVFLDRRTNTLSAIPKKGNKVVAVLVEGCKV